MVAHDFAPHCFEKGSSLFVLTSVDVGDTLSMVPVGCFRLVDVLNLEDCLILLLSALSALEV